MAVASGHFNPTDDDLTTQIETFESDLNATAINDRLVVDEGEDKFRIIWFYTP